MADLRATFDADFSSFYEACQQAVVELKSFETGASQVESKLDSMSNRFSGQKVIQDAQLMTEAIERLGGVSTLTEAELARVGRVANEAVDKMHALGMDVPKGMQELADATKGASTETQGLGVSVGQMAASYITAEAAIKLAETAYDALVSSMKSVINAASAAEEADASLLSALKAQGTAVPSVIAAYDQYAQALQNTTKYSGDAVKAAEAVLVSIGGVMPKDMQRAIQATADLATRLGVDLTSAAMTVAKAAEGQSAALTKAGVIIHGTADGAASFTDVLDQLEANLHGAAAAAGNTFAGSLAKLTNAWDNVLAATGRVIVNNQTWHDAVAGLTAIVADNTKELTDNAKANDLVSDAVILAAHGASLLVEGLDLLQTVAQGVRVVFNGLLVAVDGLGIGMLEVTRVSEAMWASLPGPAGAQATENLAAIDARIDIINGHLEDNIQSIKDADASQAAWSSTLGTFREKLDALGTSLETTRGQTRGLTTAAKENDDVWKMITENQKAHAVALEEAAKAAKIHQAAVKELESVSVDFHATVAALNPELVDVVKSYLAAGVAADTLAKALPITASQIAAVTKEVKEEAAALKLADAINAEHAKLTAQYWKVAGSMSHDATQAQINDVNAWGNAQAAAMEKAKTATAQTYADLVRIVDKSIDAIIQKTLELDPLTKAHFKKIAEEADAAYKFALAHSDQYTAEEIINLQDAAIAADEAFKDWENSARKAMDGAGDAAKTSKDLINDTTAAVKQNGDEVVAVGNRVKETWATVKETWVGVAGAVREAAEAFDQMNDMAGRSGTVPGGGNNANVTNWYDTQLGRSMSFQTMMLNKSYQESGIAYVPGRASGGAVAAGSAYVVGERGPELFVAGAGGGTILPNGGGGAAAAPTVVIQSGAFTFQYPIMNSPQALDALARTVGDALVRKLSASGLRL